MTHFLIQLLINRLPNLNLSLAGGGGGSCTQNANNNNNIYQQWEAKISQLKLDFPTTQGRKSVIKFQFQKKGFEHSRKHAQECRLSKGDCCYEQKWPWLQDLCFMVMYSKKY